MKLTGELEKKVREASDKEEAKKIIEQAGMILTDKEIESLDDKELDKVSGGREPDFDDGYLVD